MDFRAKGSGIGDNDISVSIPTSLLSTFKFYSSFSDASQQSWVLNLQLCVREFVLSMTLNIRFCLSSVLLSLFEGQFKMASSCSGLMYI